MRPGIFAKAIVLSLGIMVAAGVARAADAECLSPKSTTEKMQGPGIGIEDFSQQQVDDLGKAYSAANPGRHMVAADEALIFHRPEEPSLAWVVLFKGGCAIGMAPIDETVVDAAKANGQSSGQKPDPGAASK